MNAFEQYKNKHYLLFPLFTLFLFVSVMIFTIAQSGVKQNVRSNAQSTNCTVESSQLTQTQYEATLLRLINEYRQQSHLGTLSWSPKLKQAAAWMNNDMGAHNTFSHTDSLGRDIPTRIKACGYDYTTVGENIAKHNIVNDPQTIFDLWKNSPPHNANMLNSDFKEAGIGSGNTYWTLDLGSSSSSPDNTPTGGQVSIAPTDPANPDVSPSPVDESPTQAPSGILINQKDTEVNVSIKLNGIGKDGNKSPKHLTRSSSVAVYSPDNKLVLTGTAFLKYDGKEQFTGIVHMGQLANGPYYVKVSSTNTLYVLVLPQFQNLNSDSANVLPLVTLSQGDFNADNTIDIKDYNLALSCFQSKGCQIKDNFDLNDNGKTDVIDYNLLLSAFRKYLGD